ncbi:MAG: NUDIX hydrolase [Bacteroidetes bacterium]|nr:NUDIX hydrolase [Bacteroidota bacterium]
MEYLFNVRVYGILLNEKQELLVTDEFRFGQRITKFPGGGLQFGEGTLDCIKREMIEETGSEIEIIRHFYTTDIFQRSAFDEKHQIISIYYLICSLSPLEINIKKNRFDFDEQTEGAQIFRWIPLHLLSKEEFTFPIDQKVGQLLMDTFRS